MGQYYKPFLIVDDGTMQTAYSHDYGNGLKLIEHSWVGNNFVNAVLQNIDGNPQRLAWMGDYAEDVVDDDCDFGGGFITDKESFHKMYCSAWNDNSKAKPISKSSPEYSFSNEAADCFVVNLTKGCYIDMEKYVEENKWKDSMDSYFWCINPIPLLTSIGNGQGGGDYRGGNEDDVGSWAFDKIYMTALRPGNFEEVMYHFSER